MEKVPVSIYMDKQQAREYRARAALLGWSRSELVRRALESYFGKEKQPEVSDEKSKK